MAYYYNNEFKSTIAGSGLSLDSPFYVDNRDGKGKVNSISGDSKINESIKMILSTRVGERAFMPEFGSKLHEAIFQQNTMITRDLIKMYVHEALSSWEKRIEILEIEVGDIDDTNIIPITIYYKYKNSNVIGNYVYPFNVSTSAMDVYELGE